LNSRLLILVAAIGVAASLVWAGQRIARAILAARGDGAADRTLRLMAMFSPALAAAEGDPRAVLVWEPLARAARRIFADEFAVLDRASESTFPFGAERIQAAHAKWTSDWLAWEKAHDAEYKLKTAVAEHEAARTEDAALARQRVDAIEREKLERYQRRYEEYVRVSKALQALQQPPGPTR
jgi:hypothetical protein